MMVDDNRIKGAARNFGGKLQDTAGDLMGDTETQARGKANQAAGKAQNAYGSVIDTARGWSDAAAEMTKDKPLTALLVAVSLGYMIRLLTHTNRR